MTNEWLVEMIKCFNANKFPSYVAFRNLSDSVCLGKVWRKSPDGLTVNESSHSLYFVLFQDICVGIVYDMKFFGFGGDDLHWYVLEEHRGNGYLHRALHSVILPHIFQDGREKQLVTVKSDDETAIEYAERQGFEVVESGEHEVRMCLEPNVQFLEVLGVDRTFSKQELDELKQRVRIAKALLTSVREAVESAHGNDEKLFLEEQIDDLERTADEINFLK